jgi:DNA-binding NarL/FixJ family response regulator
MGSEMDPGTRNVPGRVLIADDHELVRDGFRRMLGYEEDLEVVGEARDGREAVELCRRLNPDLVLMDVRMPKMDGLEATRAIKAEHPSVGVLVVTTYDNPDYLLEAIKAGAAGYVLKDAPNRQLTNAIRRSLEGESPLNQELASQVIRRLAGEAAQPAQQQEPPPSSAGDGAAAQPLPKGLTPREAEVLKLVALGKTNQEVAEGLFISKATAKVHVRRVIAKLGVSDRTQAVVRAMELGLAPHPESWP